MIVWLGYESAQAAGKSASGLAKESRHWRLTSYCPSPLSFVTLALAFGFCYAKSIHQVSSGFTRPRLSSLHLERMDREETEARAWRKEAEERYPAGL